MKLLLQRGESVGEATMGKLYVNGIFECLTLEDAVREAVGQSVASWKIPGRTAIPAGTYPIVIDFSNRFQRLLPRLLNVPGFEGIRIHPGNTAADTEGCILVGQAQSVTGVIRSRLAFIVLFSKLEAAVKRGEKIEITIGQRS